MAESIGIIVNPIAGMGGRVGLKGTDGDALRLAVERGVAPRSTARAAESLRALCELATADVPFTLYAGRGPLGEDAARDAGIDPVVVDGATRLGGPTTADDTVAVARAMKERGVRLLLFAGGDGTARDVCRAVGEDCLALGIPAGVKIHSAVYASSPKAAGRVAADLLSGRIPRSAEKLAEVMDIDEDAYRSGRLNARLYGYLCVPYERGRVQNLKSGSAASDAASQAEAAQGAAVLVESEPDTLFLVGAGTTTRALLAALGIEGTLLGVDAVQGGTHPQILATDMGEREILTILDGHPTAKIVVTPIGGQGFVFGRGNQQFSPEVIRRVGRENIALLASPAKITALRGAPLLVDTGDESLDAALEGYYRIITGPGRSIVYGVKQG
ncbi:ATP-NAD kinase family protein [Synergistaceae bacterium OttesenSCG-928-I11]|nr:ATP-NAD kinase family protein [Synergistaceae bacterium OttesenSCG-928-I11]